MLIIKIGIKNDNRLINLEWNTIRENTIHAIKNGFMHPTMPPQNIMIGKDNPKSRPVYMLNKNTNEIIMKFDALADAARFLGIKPTYMSHIAQQVKGERKTAYGYKWRYADGPNS